MSRIITAVFPDRETADHAISKLRDAGLDPARTNAEDFERPEYYLNQMPQGATLVAVDPGNKGDRVAAIIRQCGGRDVDAVVGDTAGMPTAWQGTPAGVVSPADEEKRVLSHKQVEEQEAVRQTPFD